MSVPWQVPLVKMCMDLNLRVAARVAIKVLLTVPGVSVVVVMVTGVGGVPPPTAATRHEY